MQSCHGARKDRRDSRWDREPLGLHTVSPLVDCRVDDVPAEENAGAGASRESSFACNVHVRYLPFKCGLAQHSTAQHSAAQRSARENTGVIWQEAQYLPCSLEMSDLYQYLDVSCTNFTVSCCFPPKSARQRRGPVLTDQPSNTFSKTHKIDR